LQGFRPFVDFFDHLQMTREHLAGARLLANTELIAKLESACIALLSDPSALRRLMDAAGELQNRIRLAESVLVSSAETSAFVERAFAKACRDQIARLCELAEVMSRARRPEVPGFDFDSRGGGWLLASIPELEIEGPAVLLAPLRIREWAQQRIGPSFPVRDIPAAGRERWFRSRTDEQLVFSFGLANVVQHELTHSMLALANDPVEERGEMDARRWQLYRKRPEIEEGLANFTAGVCSLVTLMKAKKGLKDNALPRLFRSPYEELWTKWQSLAYSTYAEYHADATDVYFKAWESNKLDYGAFAGLTKMFATNFSELNWEATFRALREGNIATGGKRSSPS
jgi:hypothetical protein